VREAFNVRVATILQKDTRIVARGHSKVGKFEEKGKTGVNETKSGGHSRSRTIGRTMEDFGGVYQKGFSLKCSEDKGARN